MNKNVYIIAEIGPNHNGSFSRALSFIKNLKNSGVDAIKFQLANPELVYSEDSILAEYQKKSGAKSIKSMSKKNQLTKKEHFNLSKICKNYNIDYLCSAFDVNSLDFLIKKINVPILKIPSGEIASLDILQKISKVKKKIILSTGMSSISDIKKALKILNKNFKKKIILMHCVSSYPASKKDLNLNLIKKLQQIFKCEIGYSDHSLGPDACLAAVAAGAKVIEKHVTLSRNSFGPDHKSSMEIKEFISLIKKIRKVELMMGHSKKKILSREKEILKVARKSIVTKINLKKGTIICRKHLCFKRPGYGISTLLINKVIGKKININLKKNKILRYSNLVK